MSTNALVVTTRPLEDSRGVLDIVPTDDPTLWLRPDLQMAAWGTAASVPVGTGPDRFDRASGALASISDRAHVDDPLGMLGTGLIAFASFAFDSEVSGSTVTIPRRIVGRSAGTTWLTSIDAAGLPDLPPPTPSSITRPTPERDRVRFAGSSKPDMEWLEVAATAIKQIDDGFLEKVVLARDHAVWSKRPFEVAWLASCLTKQFPECFTFHVNGLIGATPELLIRREGRAVRSLALAGSTPRGHDPDEDEQLGMNLLASEKDLREHEHAARSVAVGLQPLCEEMTTRGPFLRRLDNVQHLATEVTGTLSDGRHTALELAGRLHPTAAVGGTPRVAAVELIRRLEGMNRGCYAGPVGWVSADGDGEFGIALRCAELSGARARLFAGAGIVTGSLPEDELEETRIKLRAMQGVLGS